jgi:potassium-transporting ATPase potassium-binding subunit
MDIFGAALILLIAVLLAFPLASLMKKIYSQENNFMDFMLPVEKAIYKICRIDAKKEMDWKKYFSVLLLIQIFWFFSGFILLLIQGHLFLNPAHIPDMEWTLALNSTISFLTSTNLQHYSGETGASYLSQITVFMFLQFMSAATSLSAGVAIVRGLASHSITTLGNFYADFVRSCTRILFPLSIIAATIFVFNGMPMTFKGPDKIVSLQKDTTLVALGPVAAMIPIKELGSNGGGFFGTNCAHPFENPDFTSFVVHFIIVLLLPVAFVIFICKYLNRKKFSYMLFGIMAAGLLLTAIPIIQNETRGNPFLISRGINTAMGNMEGKEVRFGSFYSAFYSSVNMVIPAGTVTGMHDSYMPLSAIGMLIGMQVDAFFGGLGTGWINMFIYLILAVFIASQMIGRTPELLGRKISLIEIQVAIVVNIIMSAVPLILTAVACSVYSHYPGGGDGLGWLTNKGPHGFTTIFYEYVSSMAGNGSEFSGLGNNTPFWNLTTCIPMLLGRYIPIIGAFIIIGSYRMKTYSEPSRGTLKTESMTFGIFQFCLILILSVLSMFIVFILGPVFEHLQIAA